MQLQDIYIYLLRQACPKALLLAYCPQFVWCWILDMEYHQYCWTLPYKFQLLQPHNFHRFLPNISQRSIPKFHPLCQRAPLVYFLQNRIVLPLVYLYKMETIHPQQLLMLDHQQRTQHNSSLLNCIQTSKNCFWFSLPIASEPSPLHLQQDLPKQLRNSNQPFYPERYQLDQYHQTIW